MASCSVIGFTWLSGINDIGISDGLTLLYSFCRMILWNAQKDGRDFWCYSSHLQDLLLLLPLFGWETALLEGRTCVFHESSNAIWCSCFWTFCFSAWPGKKWRQLYTQEISSVPSFSHHDHHLFDSFFDMLQISFMLFFWGQVVSGGIFGIVSRGAKYSCDMESGWIVRFSCIWVWPFLPLNWC